MCTRIAMWSGPRNISTAMMRAFENRPDTCVSDEPLYAHYLKETGQPHPGAAEVIASQETRWTSLTDMLLGPPPVEVPIWYQKHMAHHLLPGYDLSWVDTLQNCLLIRDPREVVSSYTRTRGTASLEDLGYPQQRMLFDCLSALKGKTPLVLDTKDILLDPERMLDALCDELGLQMDARMLSWPSGPRASDGVWERFWYDNVWLSTGFQPYRPKAEDYDARFKGHGRPCRSPDPVRHRVR